MPRSVIPDEIVSDFPLRRVPEPLRFDSYQAETSSPVDVLSDLIARYGDFLTYRTQFGTYFLLNRPSLVRTVLTDREFERNRLLSSVLGDGILSTDGPSWEQERRAMLPEFQPRSVAAMVDTFRNVVDERMRDWDEQIAGGRPIGLVHEMYRIALSNVGRALFETDFDPEILGPLDTAMRDLSTIQNASAFGFPLTRHPHTHRTCEDAMQQLEDLVRPLVGRVRSPGCPHGRMLTALQRRERNNPCGTVPPRLFRDEILTLITAGHETTAAALCWAIYLVAAHPRTTAAMYREVDEVLGHRELQESDIDRLVTTRTVIDETLRLYPPVWMVVRTVSHDVRLGTTVIPTGSGVVISAFHLHRHPDFWTSPEEFRPHRFAADAGSPNTYCYFPFLAGRHLCLGKRFALTEMIVVLAMLLQRYHFRIVSDRPPAMDPLVSLRMKGDLSVTLEPRTARTWRC